MEERLPGTVRLLFQPAEEGLGGARVMIEEGALEGAAAVFGMHVSPYDRTGTVAAKVGLGSGGWGRPAFGWLWRHQRWTLRLAGLSLGA